ncbi:hypothetical protein E2C01_001048 [Portunus trituberculatus]|uniref:Uncharacterized protein n=1 Tax=Portunus trituberculatus TaxID=210409 RepID=A0A5B7CGM5_PORTR|nr:hypothetical protein [Portunus trituberculatus]
MAERGSSGARQVYRGGHGRESSMNRCACDLMDLFFPNLPASVTSPVLGKCLAGAVERVRCRGEGGEGQDRTSGAGTALTLTLTLLNPHTLSLLKTTSCR